MQDLAPTCAVCIHPIISRDKTWSHERDRVQHLFHKACIEGAQAAQAFSDSHFTSCPLCRRTVVLIPDFYRLRDLLPDDIGLALEIAAANGQMKEAEKLMQLRRARYVPEERLAAAVRFAAEQQNIPMIRLLLSHNSNLGQFLGEALLLAVLKQDTPVVREILARVEIPEEELGRALEFAVTWGDPALIQALLENKGRVSQSHLEESLRTAVLRKDSETVRRLLSHGSFSKRSLLQSASCAIQLGDVKALSLLAAPSRRASLAMVALLLSIPIYIHLTNKN